MWFKLSSSFSRVLLNDIRVVQGHSIERIDSDKDDTGIGVNKMLHVSSSDGVQHY